MTQGEILPSSPPLTINSAWDGVGVAVGAGVEVGVAVGVPAGVAVGVAVAVPIGVAVGVAVAVAVGVGVGVGLLVASLKLPIRVRQLYEVVEE